MRLWVASAVTLACALLSLPSVAAEVVSLSSGTDENTVPDVAKDIRSSMKRDASAADSAAMAAAAKAVKAQAEAAQNIESTRGIPAEIVDALSTSNIAVKIREGLEQLALPENSPPGTPADVQVQKEVNQRISKAALKAMADPNTVKAMNKVTKAVVDKEVREREAQALMKSKVEAKVAAVANEADQSARAKANALLKRATQVKRVLAGLQRKGELTSTAAQEKAEARKQKAQETIRQARKFLVSGTSSTNKQVHAAVAQSMSKETHELKEEIAPKAKQHVEDNLARQVALEAQRQLKLKAEAAEREAKKKAREAEKKQRIADDKHDELTKLASKAEAKSFSQSVSLSKEQGYWSNRRRFSRQKHFIQYGSFTSRIKPRAQERKEKQQAADRKQKDEANEKLLAQQVEKTELRKEVQADIPKGSVSKLVEKLTKKDMLEQVDEVPQQALMKVTSRDVDAAVSRVMKFKSQTTKSNKSGNSTKTSLPAVRFE